MPSKLPGGKRQTSTRSPRAVPSSARRRQETFLAWTLTSQSSSDIWAESRVNHPPTRIPPLGVLFFKNNIIWFQSRPTFATSFGYFSSIPNPNLTYRRGQVESVSHFVVETLLHAYVSQLPLTVLVQKRCP